MKKFYVSMTDKFMSGWGMAQGKINKLVIECDSADQAFTIIRNAKKRPEMRYINLCDKKPRYPTHSHLVSLKHFSDFSGPWIDGVNA